MPTPEKVNLALETIAKSTANYQYFFQRLDSEAWLAPLDEKGRFGTPPPKVEVEGGVMFPGWPESQYLVRMASKPAVQQEVLRIVLAMPDTDNIRVHNDLLEIALLLPVAEAARLVTKARTWVQTPYRGMVGYKIGDLIAKLASGGQAAAALQLAKDTFSLLPPTPAAPDADTKWAPSPEPRAWLEDWNYEDSLKKAARPLVDAGPERAFALLCKLLAQAIDLSRRTDEPGNEDYSHIWHERIESDEFPASLKNILFSAVRDAAMQIMEATPAALTVVIQELRRHAWPVFKRIELYLLDQFIDLGMEETILLAPELATVQGSTHREAARLLKHVFGRLPAETKEEVLRRIDIGPEEVGVVRWLTFIGREPTPEAVEQFGVGWRAERFALFVDQIPPAWRDRVNAVIARTSEVRQLDKTEGRRTWTGPTSPKSVEELGLMGPEQTLVFLRNWNPPPGEYEPTPEGLGRNLEGVIAADPAGYAQRAEEFMTLDPTYARFFFSGLEVATRSKRPFAWGPVLSVARWVTEQPREIPGRKKAMMEADESWQWTRGVIAYLLEHGVQQNDAATVIPFAERERVWAVLEPLTSDPDPTPAHEKKYGGDNMDAPTLAINSVRGKAFNAAVAYALWVRRNLDTQDPRPPATFDVMPEVRRVLDDHLDVRTDPSLAIRSCYGRHFPWLQFLDKGWAETAVGRVFPADERLAAYRTVAWDAYVLLCPAYDAVLPTLEQEYLRAVRELPNPEPEKKQTNNPRHKLAEHVMAYYWRGKLTITGGLLTSFFQFAAEDIRGRAIDSVGRWLSTRPEGSIIDADVLSRLRALWEWRVQVARDSGNVLGFQKELSRFGWWFASRAFDDLWSLTQLRTTLDLVKTIEPQFKVGEALEALSPTFPLECVQCARLLAESDREGWQIYGSENHFKGIISAAISSDNRDAKAAADRLIQYMVGRGQFDYRSLLR